MIHYVKNILILIHFIAISAKKIYLIIGIIIAVSIIIITFIIILIFSFKKKRSNKSNESEEIINININEEIVKTKYNSIYCLYSLKEGNEITIFNPNNINLTRNDYSIEIITHDNNNTRI